MNTLFEIEMPSELLDWTAWFYPVMALLVLWLGSLTYRTVRKVNLMEELARKDNPALAISYAGFMAALGIVIVAVIQSPSHAEMNWHQELLDCVWWTLGGGVLLVLALFINDLVIFPKFKNRKEILEDRNTGLAVVEASSFVATAFLLKGSLSEQLAPTELGEPWLTLLYFVIGQGFFLLYSKVYPKVSGLDLHGELERDNPAVGLAFGCSMLAFAWMIATAQTYYDGLPTILFLAIVYMVILGAVRLVVRMCLSKKVSLVRELQEDRNWGVGILEATISLVLAATLISSF